MQYGVCGGPEIAEAAAGAGFDYIEWSVGALLHPSEPELAFQQSLQILRKAVLPCLAVNCFVPQELKITGPAVSFQALERYVAIALHRAEKSGVKTIVFGSGGARRIPDGFNRDQAFKQIVDFGRMCGSIAEEHGVIVVMEPLSSGDTNMINTVADGAAVVAEVNNRCFRLLVDSYHWMREKDSLASISSNGALLAHAHIATATNRLAPGAEPCDFAPFFAALKNAGYNGRISIECNIRNPGEDLPRALQMMKTMATW